jgi:hypothetical protein
LTDASIYQTCPEYFINSRLPPLASDVDVKGQLKFSTCHSPPKTNMHVVTSQHMMIAQGWHSTDPGVSVTYVDVFAENVVENIGVLSQNTATYKIRTKFCKTHPP